MNVGAGVCVDWKTDKEGKKVLNRMGYCPSTSNLALRAGLPMLATDATHFKTVYDGSLLILSHLTVLRVRTQLKKKEHTRTHTHTHIHACVFTFTMDSCAQARACYAAMCMYVCMCMYVFMYVCVCGAVCVRGCGGARTNSFVLGHKQI
jgi:hypothetical protein